MPELEEGKRGHGDYPSSAIEDLHKDAKNALLVLDGVDERFDDEKPSVRIGRYAYDYPSYTAIRSSMTSNPSTWR